MKPIPRPLVRALAITWTVLILIGTLMPPRSLSRIDEKKGIFLAIPYFDKIVHFTMFAGFGVLWWLAMEGKPRRMAWVLLSGLALGALTEVAQTLPIVNRDGGLDDMAADSLGVLAAVVVMNGLSRLGK